MIPLAILAKCPIRAILVVRFRLVGLVILVPFCRGKKVEICRGKLQNLPQQTWAETIDYARPYEQSFEMAFNFFFNGHLRHVGISPGTPNRLCCRGGADGLSVGGCDARRPRSQSAEQACMRQILASISAPGALSPRSYLAQCWYLIPKGAAIAACDCEPRSSLRRSDSILIVCF